MLTQSNLRQIKAQRRMKRYYDEHDLYLHFMPQGGRY